MRRIFEYLTSPIDEKTHWRIIAIAGHLTFWVMGIYSLVYFRERMLHFDTANYAFHMIYNGDYFYGKGREITWVMQVLPLWVFKSGASLKAILQAYSISFILVYYLIFNIIVYGFRNVFGGIFMALAMCLSVRYKFFAPVGEVVIGISAVCLLAGWLTKDRERFARLPKWVDWLVGCLLVAFISTTHPFVYFSTVVVLGFVLVHYRRWQDWSYWGVVAFTLAAIGRYALLISEDEYGSDRAAPLFNAWEIISNYSDYYVWSRIIRYYDTEYHLPALAFLMALVAVAWQKKWLTSLYLGTAFAALMAIILVTYSYLGIPVYLMIDGYMSHLGVVWALPIAFILLQARQRIWLYMTCILLVFSLDRIRNKREFYQERQAYFEAAIEQHCTEDDRKLMGEMNDFNWKMLWMPWPVAIETLMLTCLDGPENGATIFFRFDDKAVEAKLEDENLFLGVQYAPLHFKTEHLPSHLFQLKPGLYKRVPLH